MNKTYDIVKKILQDKPETRDSDRLLIWEVFEELGYARGETILKVDFMEAPAVGTITRCRRKLQEEYPYLKSNPYVQEKRKEKENTKGTFIYRELGQKNLYE